MHAIAPGSQGMAKLMQHYAHKQSQHEQEIPASGMPIPTPIGRAREKNPYENQQERPMDLYWDAKNPGKLE